ncbi:hypothetical protein IAQ61_008883, partial [Plenodomus lingam]|uniref:uncharacterized protein n=1 Tax=Leptosphaeria maculans TaxID=5022 RepID=UPI00332802B8
MGMGWGERGASVRHTLMGPWLAAELPDRINMERLPLEAATHILGPLSTLDRATGATSNQNRSTATRGEARAARRPACHPPSALAGKMRQTKSDSFCHWEASAHQGLALLQSHGSERRAQVVKRTPMRTVMAVLYHGDSTAKIHGPQHKALANKTLAFYLCKYCNRIASVVPVSYSSTQRRLVPSRNANAPAPTACLATKVRKQVDQICILAVPLPSSLGHVLVYVISIPRLPIHTMCTMFTYPLPFQNKHFQLNEYTYSGRREENVEFAGGISTTIVSSRTGSTYHLSFNNAMSLPQKPQSSLPTNMQLEVGCTREIIPPGFPQRNQSSFPPATSTSFHH